MIALILIALYLVVIPSIFLSLTTRYRVEHYIAVMLPAYSVWLYLCGMINCLTFGRMTINLGIIISFCCFVYYIIIQIRRGKARDIKEVFLNNTLTPGLLIFLVGIVFLSYLSYGRVYSEPDEFSHWGRVVRILFAFDKLPIKDESISNILSFRNYPLGTSLIGYLFEKQKTSQEYYDYIHIFSMSTIYLSVFEIFLCKSKWQDFHIALTVFLFVYFTCLTFNETYITSVYVDILLGVVLAACFYSLIVFRNSSVTDSIFVTIFLSFLILIKPSGVGLAVLVFIPLTIYAFCRIIRFLKHKKHKVFFAIVPSLLPYCSLLIYFIHKQSLNRLTYVAFSDKDISFKNFSDSYYFDQNGLFSEVFNKMIDSLFFSAKSYFVIPTSFFAVVLFFSIILLVSYKLKKDHNFFVAFSPFLFVLGFFIYSFTLLLYYNFSTFTPQEATTLASFDRYLSSYMVFVILTTLSALNYYSYKRTDIVSILFYIVLLSPFLQLPRFTKSIKSYFAPVTNNSMAEYSSVFPQIINQYISENDKFYVLNPRNRGGETFIASTYFPKNYIRTPISWDEPSFSGWFAAKYSNKEVQNILKLRKYCYVFRTSEHFIETYGHFFDNMKPNERNSLYLSNNGIYTKLPLSFFLFDFEKCSLFSANCIKAFANYSARNALLEIGMMKKGEVLLTPKPFCPIENGLCTDVIVKFKNIKGVVNFTVKINGDIFYNDQLSDSISTIPIKLQQIKLNDLSFQFTCLSDYGSVFIDTIRLDYNNSVIIRRPAPKAVPAAEQMKE